MFRDRWLVVLCFLAQTAEDTAVRVVGENENQAADFPAAPHPDRRSGEVVP